MSTKSAFLAILFCLLAAPLFAQIENPDYEGEDGDEITRTSQDAAPSLMDRLYFGGNVGLSLGDITFIDISPLVGYQLTDKFSMGLGGTYRYLHNKIFDLRMDVTGGRLFARYDISPVIYPYAEYERLSFRFGDSNAPRLWNDALFGGVGFFQPVGRRGGINILALYMLNWDNASPNRIYNNPWQFRVGFQF